MGQTLSTPATEKTSQTGENKRFAYAVSEMQGWRISMEDAHAMVHNLDEAEEEDKSNAFFAVYDGHGGGTVAKFAGNNVHRRLITEDSYRKKDYETAMKRAFLGTDEDLLADPALARDPSGCTAVAALITPENKIYVANAGDSRSVISVKGEVKPLSYDHKPSNEGERARITAAGGYIEYGRVNGNLALSRALGDFQFKKNYSVLPEDQIITANPDITVHQITEEDEFLVIACDGIWDCLTSQQVVDVVRLKIAEGKNLTEIGEFFCDHCLAPDTSSGAGIGCDNMTMMIIALLNGRTKEEWAQWVTERVKSKYGYATPVEVPQLYAQSRLLSFRARREAQEDREWWRQDREDNYNNANSGPGLMGGSNAFGGFARVLGSTGGISFHPGSGIMSDTGTLMFGHEDSDDDDSGDEMDVEKGSNTAKSFFADSFGAGGESGSSDVTGSLKARLDEYEKGVLVDGMDEDGDSQMSDEHDEVKSDGTEPSKSLPTTTKADAANHVDGIQGEAPPPPKLTNGDVKPVEQLKSLPGGDAPSPAVKAEGLLDKSEDPLKVSA